MSSLPSHWGCLLIVPWPVYHQILIASLWVTLSVFPPVLTHHYPLFHLLTFTAPHTPSAPQPFRTNSFMLLFLFLSVTFLDSEHPAHSLATGLSNAHCWVTPIVIPLLPEPQHFKSFHYALRNLLSLCHLQNPLFS